MQKFIDKNIVLEAIKNKITKKDLSAKLGISTPTLRKWLIQNNINYDISLYKFIDKEWFIHNWLETTKSLNSLSKEYNISLSLLETRASKFGITKPCKYNTNNKILDLTDPHLYYLAGLVATDGYLGHSLDTIEITLCGNSEFILLNAINTYYDSNNNIKEFKPNTYTLSLYHKGLHKLLNDSFNIPVKNKTFSVGVPQTFHNEYCAKAYILGCIDGDGWICSNYYRFSICNASLNFIKGIQSIIKKYTNLDIPILFNKSHNKIYPCLTTSKNKAKEFLKWLYSDDVSFKLLRKYENYKRVEDIV